MAEVAGVLCGSCVKTPYGTEKTSEVEASFGGLPGRIMFFSTKGLGLRDAGLSKIGGCWL